MENVGRETFPSRVAYLSSAGLRSPKLITPQASKPESGSRFLERCRNRRTSCFRKSSGLIGSTLKCCRETFHYSIAGRLPAPALNQSKTEGPRRASRRSGSAPLGVACRDKPGLNANAKRLYAGDLSYVATRYCQGGRGRYLMRNKARTAAHRLRRR